MSFLNDTDIRKAFGLPSSDATHQYVFKSGEYGTMYQYWYRDQLGNYYRYTNAPVDDADYDPFLGPPLLDPEQPLPEKQPNFFTEEGFKRNVSLPEGVSPERNPAYNQTDARNIWFEVANHRGQAKYIYLDADIKENLDLYVQNQLRVVDSALPKFREYATTLFTGSHIKDRLTGAILILVDQGLFSVEDLVAATVGDVDFIDQTVRLLGRKFVCDLAFLDFMTSLVAMRSPTDPLFTWETNHGAQPVGANYIYSVFNTLRVSPKFLLYWNASHMFSRIVNRLSFQEVPADTVESQAFDELARALNTAVDVRYLVDYKVRTSLMRNYGEGATEDEPISKSLMHLVTDDFGIAVIRSDLTSRRPDEEEFSAWLQATPMHDTSPAEEQLIQEQLDAEPEEASSAEEDLVPAANTDTLTDGDDSAGPEAMNAESGREE